MLIELLTVREMKNNLKKAIQLQKKVTEKINYTLFNSISKNINIHYPKHVFCKTSEIQSITMLTKTQN